MHATPRHVGIIMDGNGRWAQRRRRPRVFGHQQGLKALLALIRYTVNTPLETLTLYAFSRENWKRPASEIHLLQELMVQGIESHIDEMDALGVRIRFWGDLLGVPESLRLVLQDAQERTSGNKALEVVVAFNYSGRWQMTEVVRALVDEVATGVLAPVAVNEAWLHERMMQGFSEPDLLIRSGGEHRLSNFMLWQMAYTELYFTPTYWPDFTPEDYEQALQDFASRHRRFGALDQSKGVEL